MNVTFDADFCADLVYCFEHFLWQASLVGMVYFLAVRGLQDRTPGLRYRFGMFSLLVCAGCVPVTFLATHDDARAAERVIQTDTATVPGELANAPSNHTVATGTMPAAFDSSASPAGGNSFPPPKTTFRKWSAESLAPAIVTAYLAGVALLLFRLAFGVCTTFRYRRASEPVSQPEIKRLIEAAARNVGLAVTPPVRWSGQVVVPSVIGVIRPIIYLPLTCATGLTSEQLRHVLTHEMAHIRRWDPIFSLLQNVIESLLFFHPVVWLISRQVRLERESCCDAIAARDAVSAADYASTLLEIASWSKGLAAPAGSLAATGHASQLKLRIHRLLGIRTTRSTRWIEGGSTILVALALSLFVMMATHRSATAEPPAQTESKDHKQKPSAEIPLEAKPGRIVGEVVDEDGKPIEGVLVDAWTWWKGTETTTEAQGRFSLDPKTEPRERAEVRFSKPGYSPHYILQQSVGAGPIRIVLNNKTYIEGTVTGSDGEPVVGATLRGIQPPQRGDGVVISSVTTETLTDEHGRYRLYLFPDTYEIRVSAPKRGVARLSEIKVPAGEGQSLDIKLSKGVRFEANVVDSVTGQPVEGLVVWSWREKGVFGKSDKNGKLAIDALLPGPFDFDIGGGKPIKNKQFDIDLYRHGPFGRWWSEDAMQPWEHKSIKPGEFQRNFDNLQFNLTVGMDPVTIVAERGVVFTGKVFDPDGKPVAGATVAPAKTGSGNSLTGDTRYSVETDEDGSYRVVMPAGNDFEYNLIAHDGKYEEWRHWANGITETIESHPGDEIEVNITLNRPCTVRGKVTADGIADLSKRKVRAHAVDRHGNRYYDPTVTTDKDGNFELKFIRPGKHFIQVEPFWLNADEALLLSTAVVELTAGETREGIELKHSNDR